MSAERSSNSDTAYRRARSSIDVDRPPVDPSILGIPQGWDDDSSVSVPGDSVARTVKRLPLHLTPLRQRVKLASLASKSRQPIGPASHSPAALPEPGGLPALGSGKATSLSAARLPEALIQASSKGFIGYRASSLFDSPLKRNLGESVYCVGYEREVLDTEARLHETLHALFGSHCLAEFTQPPREILDLGTGLGLWPLSVSAIWRDAHIIGYDRASVQVELGHHGDTCADRVVWQQGDFLEALPFDSESFDYVHMRFIGLGVPEAAWPRLLDEACRVLRVGGKLEIVDASLQNSPTPTAFQNSFSSLLSAHGIAESPARPIKFVLPMLEGISPQSIQPKKQHDFDRPPGALRDAIPCWTLSALSYHSSSRDRPETCKEACRSLGWNASTSEACPQPLELTAWVVTRV